MYRVLSSLFLVHIVTIVVSGAQRSNVHNLVNCLCDCNGCCSHCVHGGDVVVVIVVCVKINVFVATVVGAVAVKDVMAFDGNEVVFIVVVVTVVAFV